MDGDQQQAASPQHKNRRSRPKRNKKKAGSKRHKHAGEMMKETTTGMANEPAPAVHPERQQRGGGDSSNANLSASSLGSGRQGPAVNLGGQQQQQQQRTSQQSPKAPKSSPGSLHEIPGSSGDGERESKKSRKRRRKEAALAAATAALASPLSTEATKEKPPITAAVSGEPASSCSNGGGKRSSDITKKAQKDTDTTFVDSSRDIHRRKRSKKRARYAITTTNGEAEVAGRASNAGSISQASVGGTPLSRGSGKVARDSPKKGFAVASAGKTGGGSSSASRLSELQKRMRQKLEGAQFRMINETLYTSESGVSLAKFKKEPELFDVYHRGFREQVEKWPVHPLDMIIDWLRKYPKARVADFGCGEGRLAATVPNKVHSFDLVSPNPMVTACDMANVPIKAASVHVAVFCLSLMGTNLADFLREAHRVLVPGGLMKVAEVRSRFEGEKDGVERFLEVTKRLGFDTRQMDRTNKMFLMAEFQKSKRKPERGVEFEAKACIYKRR